MEKTQRQETRAVRDSAQHLAPAAENDLGEQHLAFDRRALSRAQLAERHHPRPVLVAQRQKKQQVLGGLDSQRPQPLRKRIADAAQGRDRLRSGHGVRGHRATMHSTSTCAPRGRAATPTAARAGYGSRKYSAMTLFTSAK